MPDPTQPNDDDLEVEPGITVRKPPPQRIKTPGGGAMAFLPAVDPTRYDTQAAYDTALERATQASVQQESDRSRLSGGEAMRRSAEARGQGMSNYYDPDTNELRPVLDPRVTIGGGAAPTPAPKGQSYPTPRSVSQFPGGFQPVGAGGLQWDEESDPDMPSGARRAGPDPGVTRTALLAKNPDEYRGLEGGQYRITPRAMDTDPQGRPMSTVGGTLRDLRATRLRNALDEETQRSIDLTGGYSHDPTEAAIRGFEKEEAYSGAEPLGTEPPSLSLNGRDVTPRTSASKVPGLPYIPGLTPSRGQAYEGMLQTRNLGIATSIADKASELHDRVDAQVAAKKLSPADAQERHRQIDRFALSQSAILLGRNVPGLGGALRSPNNGLLGLAMGTQEAEAPTQ